ncbi:hypothetical protein BJI67_09930 [Acidihalobacter aeolianus]|uniref:UPF0125 protein BJI67_09930 n=1 Tax=Acidihalobacter aeolianus TaxID=2792603 RepID=A0A1D8KC58_9GAMM|nr:RnfH family protein [Acidihalobacter aeolianus]AOV18555.1 hypothetical protein BJI67_09930 [Acidihalobacter aeolianus]
MYVEIVYATAERQELCSVRIPSGSTLADAIQASGRFAPVLREPDIHTRVGVFGRRRALSDGLMDGDRVEIYRPLQVDPKEARRRRAQGAMADGDSA